MRDEVVTLEHEADGVVAVGIPVAALVLLGGDAVDHQIAGIIMVEPADNVEQRGFARSGRTEDGHELAVAQVQADIVQRLLHEIAGFVLFGDALDLQHAASSRLIVVPSPKRGALEWSADAVAKHYRAIPPS